MGQESLEGEDVCINCRGFFFFCKKLISKDVVTYRDSF